MEFETPAMSPELMAAVSTVKALTSERDRIKGVLRSEREKFRDQQVNFEEARSILSARESEQALSGGAPDLQFRRNFAAARDELEMLGARTEGVSARLAVVERDLDAARAQLGDVFEVWRSAEEAKSADRLAVAMQSLADVLTREYAVSAGLNAKRLLTLLRGVVLFNPHDPGRALFHGSNLRAGRFRSDASASALADDVIAIRLRVAELLGTNKEAVDTAVEEEITR